jgi:hypothetical protein
MYVRQQLIQIALCIAGQNSKERTVVQHRIARIMHRDELTFWSEDSEAASDQNDPKEH